MILDGSQLKWSFLAWNVRGINSQAKWNAIQNKISENNCSLVCLQETKRNSFDFAYLKNFCLGQLGNFEFSPSIGASGGFITIWNDSLIEGELVLTNSYSSQ
jgi:exonuclease III